MAVVVRSGSSRTSGSSAINSPTPVAVSDACLPSVGLQDAPVDHALDSPTHDANSCGRCAANASHTRCHPIVLSSGAVGAYHSCPPSPSPPHHALSTSSFSPSISVSADFRSHALTRSPTVYSVPGALSCLASQTTTAAMSKPWTRTPKLTGFKPAMPECWGHRGVRIDDGIKECFCMPILLMPFSISRLPPRTRRTRSLRLSGRYVTGPRASKAVSGAAIGATRFLFRYIPPLFSFPTVGFFTR